MDEQVKQKILIRKLGKLLTNFGLFLTLLILAIGISLVPMLLYIQLESKSVEDLDMSSISFIISMILGSVVIFIIPSRKKRKDYSDRHEHHHLPDR